MSADTDEYDEFGMLGDNAAEAGLTLRTLPPVTRTSFTLADGDTVSALAWGDAPPELVLLHGGGQNAHTWDTVALALGRPLLAVDLPGHGHSGRRQDRDYGPWRNAEAVASVIGEAGARRPRRGGDVAWRHHRHPAGGHPPGPGAPRGDRRRDPEQRRPLAVHGAGRPGCGRPGQRAPCLRVVRGDGRRGGRGEPDRPRSAVERGVRHNARRLPDGRWTWRYDLFGDRPAAVADHTGLWADVSAITVPLLLVIGADSPFTSAEDMTEFRRRLPAARVEVVPGAGHAIQSDQPLALAALIEDFVSQH